MDKLVLNIRKFVLNEEEITINTKKISNCNNLLINDKKKIFEKSFGFIWQVKRKSVTLQTFS